MKRNFKSEVYHIANELVKNTGKSKAVCLAKAWCMYRLTQQMRQGVVNFAYEKADGTLRKAQGTLPDKETQRQGKRKESHKTLCYFDLQANDFRSFKIENFITTYP